MTIEIDLNDFNHLLAMLRQDGVDIQLTDFASKNPRFKYIELYSATEQRLVIAIGTLQLSPAEISGLGSVEHRHPIYAVSNRPDKKDEDLLENESD